LQPLQHPHACAMREVGVPSRIEWVSVRFNSDVPNNPSIEAEFSVSVLDLPSYPRV
jgi:hypothetical protein